MEGLGEKGEGIKPPPKHPKLIDTDNSMVITRGKGWGWGEVEEGKEGTNELGW